MGKFGLKCIELLVLIQVFTVLQGAALRRTLRQERHTFLICSFRTLCNSAERDSSILNRATLPMTYRPPYEGVQTLAEQLKILVHPAELESAASAFGG